MPSWYERNDWESALARWTSAGLIESETSVAIRAWEDDQAAASSKSRLVDALSYLGVSVVLVGVLMLSALLFDDGGAWIALPFVIGVVAAGLSWWSHRSDQQALADGFAGAAVLLIAVGLGWVLDEVGEEGRESIGWLLICVCVLLTGGLMVQLVRSRIAVVLATLALSLMPAAIALEGGAFDAGIFRRLACSRGLGVVGRVCDDARRRRRGALPARTLEPLAGCQAGAVGTARRFIRPGSRDSRPGRRVT